VESGSGLGADGSYSANAATNYIKTVTSLKDADEKLDAQLKTTTDELNTTEAGAGLGTDGTYTANASTNYIKTVTSLKDADNKLDAQLKTNTDAIASGVTNLSALQTEVNTTQTGAGLGTDGTYTANASTNYIKTVTSLKDADEKLDAQLKTTTDELNTTEAGAGLDTDGTYTANAASNYIKTVTSLKDADNKLDAQIKTNAEAIATGVTDLTDLQAEVDNTEAGAGLETDGSYLANASTNYIKTVTSLKDADEKIDAQVKTTNDDLATEKTRATGAETTLATNLSSEVTRATGVEDDLQTELNTTQAGAGLGATGSYTADGSTNYIKTASSLMNADKLLDAQIKANTDAIATGVTDLTDLQVEVDNTEAGAGLETDGSYLANASTNYIKTVTSLKDADEKLDAQVKTTNDDLATEKTRATGAETTLATNLSSEVTRATGVEDDLQTELNTTQAGAGLGATGSYTADGSTNYIKTASSLMNADKLLDAQVNQCRCHCNRGNRSY
jgi:hypothetical protein